jgi:hypothetical protein
LLGRCWRDLRRTLARFPGLKIEPKFIDITKL